MDNSAGLAMEEMFCQMGFWVFWMQLGTLSCAHCLRSLLLSHALSNGSEEMPQNPRGGCCGFVR